MVFGKRYCSKSMHIVQKVLQMNFPHAISMEMHVKLHTPVPLSEVSDVMAIFSNGRHCADAVDRPLIFSRYFVFFSVWSRYYVVSEWSTIHLLQSDGLSTLRT